MQKIADIRFAFSRFMLPVFVAAALLSPLYARAHAASGLQREAFDLAPIGPYTRIELPLEIIPQQAANHPAYTGYDRGTQVQVLAVFEDPRQIPLARFGYYDEARGQAVTPSEGWVHSAGGYAPAGGDGFITLDVYVRVTAPGGARVHDPIFGNYYAGKTGSPAGMWPPLYVMTGGYTRGPGGEYVCALPEYAAGVRPYELSPDVEGGGAVTREGLYDPAAYAPPEPWYDSNAGNLDPGEVREGWLLCLAPAAALADQELQWNEYTRDGQDVIVDFASAWQMADVTGMASDGFVGNNIQLRYAMLDGSTQEESASLTALPKLFIRPHKRAAWLVTEMKRSSPGRAPGHAVSVEIGGGEWVAAIYAHPDDLAGDRRLAYPVDMFTIPFRTGLAPYGYRATSLKRTYAWTRFEFSNDGGIALPDTLWVGIYDQRLNHKPEYLVPLPVQDIPSRGDTYTSMCDKIDCIEHAFNLGEAHEMAVLCPGEVAGGQTVTNLRLSTVSLANFPNDPVAGRYGLADLTVLVPTQDPALSSQTYRLLSLSSKTGINGLATPAVVLGEHNETMYYQPLDVSALQAPIHGSLSVAGDLRGYPGGVDDLALASSRGVIWSPSCGRQTVTGDAQQTSAGDLPPARQGKDEHAAIPADIFPGFLPPSIGTSSSGGLAPIGDTRQIGGAAVRPEDVLVIPGAEAPTIYDFADQQLYTEGLMNPIVYVHRPSALLLPPGSSAVLVKVERSLLIEQERSAPLWYDLALDDQPPVRAYTIAAGPLNWGQYAYADPSGWEDGWLLFYVPSLDVDISALVFRAYRGHGFVRWSLAGKHADTP